MRRQHETMSQLDNVCILSSDMKVVDEFINKDIRSTKIPEEVYWVLSAVTSAFYGRRREQ